MVYTYTPTYYSTLHDSITSLCKNILPFSVKKRRLPEAEHRLSKLQSDNLKWQQDSFHQIMNLMGLHREGILAETEVLAFRIHLLETLIASPVEHEHPSILRDKLIFLQELFYARCISEDEYHSSKRPLLQRLAVQGAEIEARDVIVSSQKELKENTEEHWSEIDLRDEKCSSSKENPRSKGKSKPGLAIKQIKGAASALGFGSSHKQNASKGEKSIFEIHAQFASSGFVNDGEKENPHSYQNMNGKESETKSILMQESLHADSVRQKSSAETAKRKPFKKLFQWDPKEGQSSGVGGHDSEERASKWAKKQWGFDGFKKWVRNDSDDETAPLPLNNEKSDCEAYSGASHLVTNPIGEGPDTKQIKRKLHSNGAPSDFFIDKILGDNIKKELSKIQAELSTTNPNLKFSDDQIEAISTKLPVDKADLKKYFPKSWCDRYGDVVLDVVKKEFEDHVGAMENGRTAVREKRNSNSMRWTTFEDDNDYENHHPNLFATHDHSFSRKDELDVVLDVVKKEFEDHVGAMENGRTAVREKRNSNSMRWTTFEDDNDYENHHPNLFATHDHSFSRKDEFSGTNPFFNDKLRISSSFQYQNPFWNHGQKY